ncbi:MAG: helix-turn-helix domain-containing protein [Anaerolineales bacterium]|nr:helix-turn-helix domain-containing protein [Anaerolineales bacterium]
MNRKEFGELVATLRQDLGWTQFHLAEYADLDEAVVSQIERGVKKYFEPELLFHLANALQLTSLERHEFVLAASGLDEKQIVRQPSAMMATDVFHPAKILERMLALTADIRVPAFLNDVYGDVIAANRMMLAFYNVPPSMLETAATVPGGYNTTRLNFGRDLVGRKHVLDNWDHYALNSMRAFRENSLLHRAKPYFKYLMKNFRNPTEYPFFDRYWKLVSSTEQDKEMRVDHFSYRHSEFGPLKYIASMTITVTSFGNLFLVQNLPLDEHTDEVFTQLKLKAGTGAVRFAPWPEKPMP